MIRHARRGLLALTALLVIAAPAVVPSAAQADIGIQSVTTYCDRYFGTGYGPIGQCLRVVRESGVTTRATVGFYSPLTGGFSPTTGSLTFASGGQAWLSSNVPAEDGSGTYDTRGYGLLNGGYGPVVFANQMSGGYGRWGTWSAITGLFYPASGWMPFAGYPCAPIVSGFPPSC